jgi:hypothetical protein
MGANDIIRLQVQEGAYTFTNTRLHKVLKEIDMRTAGADVYVDITRTSGLISLIEVYSDAARTQKVCEQQVGRSAGVGGVEYVTTLTNIFYNANGTEDSRTTETISRPNLGTDDIIEACDSPFSTSESTKL